MIALDKDELLIRFPEVHPEAAMSVTFHRTLRIPDDGRDYPLPPGLGRFPLAHVDDHAALVPPDWLRHGGILLPMYQAEALWLSFHGRYPFALKVAAGKINALTGESWSNRLSAKPQDYLVTPGQPWLDGFCIRQGLVRQFVAMPMGRGYTAEEQLTGAATFGGLQLIAYPMKAEAYERLPKPDPYAPWCKVKTFGREMGLAAGGLIKQEIYRDEHGFEAWDQTAASRVFVHMLNSYQWEDVTGSIAPGQPPSAADYAEAGLPWFAYYDETLVALAGAGILDGLDSVATTAAKVGDGPLPENASVRPRRVFRLGSLFGL